MRRRLRSWTVILAVFPDPRRSRSSWLVAFPLGSLSRTRGVSDGGEEGEKEKTPRTKMKGSATHSWG